MNYRKLASVLAAVAALTATAGAQTTRHWNQEGGNAAGTSASSVEPMRADALRQWALRFDGILCDPVTWGDTVFLVVEQKRQRKLWAVDARTGEEQGTASLGRGDGPIDLAVWEGTVLVVEEDQMRTYVHKRGTLKKRKGTRGSFLGPPAIFGDLVVLGGYNDVFVYDLGTLKPVGHCKGGYGRPAVVRRENDALIATLSVGQEEGYVGNYLRLYTARIKGFADRKPELVHERSSIICGVLGRGREVAGYCAALENTSKANRYEDAWFLLSPWPIKLKVQQEDFYGTVNISDSGTPVAGAVAIDGDKCYGFGANGDLIGFDITGAARTLVGKSELPEGARTGRPTIAGDVLYLENWAVELASGRVLWCRSDIHAPRGLIPAGDGRAVAVAGRSLIGYADVASEAVAGATGEEAARPPATRPGTGPGLVLADGSRLEGQVEELPTGAFRVAGTETEFQATEVSLVEDVDEARLVGEEYGLYLAWRTLLEREHANLLEEVFRGFLKDRLLDECRRVLEEALDYGLEPSRAKELQNLTSGKGANQASNAAAKLRRRKREELAARNKSGGGFVEAADWCAARGFHDAASVLLADAATVDPDIDREELDARVERSMPSSFPWGTDGDATSRWLAWAPELLPAAGRFLERGDPLWNRTTTAPWDRKGTLALRTRNLVLFTRDDDPELMGRCLRRGEGTVRALVELLGTDDEGELPPLDVRIHESRKQFLAEGAPEWSGGYYVPSAGVSRFYVPRDSEANPNERSLDSVLSHELTHHFLDERWEPSKSRPDHRGFWIVEGFARFVEDQFLELGRGQRRFDDPTVESVDISAALAREDLLFSARRLLQMTQVQFASLSDEPKHLVQPRYTIGRRQLTDRNQFYEQSGGLVYFLMTAAGPDTAAALVDLMRSYYRGKPVDEPWDALGFDSAKGLDRSFEEFLKGL